MAADEELPFTVAASPEVGSVAGFAMWAAQSLFFVYIMYHNFYINSMNLFHLASVVFYSAPSTSVASELFQFVSYPLYSFGAYCAGIVDMTLLTAFYSAFGLFFAVSVPTFNVWLTQMKSVFIGYY